MCNLSGIVFAFANLTKEEVSGKKVIEVGSRDVNGTLRPIIELWEPAEYIGIDTIKGPGVDMICDAENLIERLGKEKFDIVVSTELLEHINDWRQVISNIKNICKSDGIILITTRSHGFPYHGYPHDFWRFELEDMKAIFSDCKIIALQKDYREPGVFIKVEKPKNYTENDLSKYELHNVIVNKRVREITDNAFRNLYFIRLLIKLKIRSLVVRSMDFLLSRL